MAKQTFTVGQVLTAAQVQAVQTNDYNQTVSVKTASYTLVAADVGTRIEMNSGSATTVTVNTALFAAGDTLIIQNKGAGVSTVTAGTATVSTSGSLALAQYDQGTLYFVSTGVAIFFNATAGAADIPKTLLTTTGDTIYASAANTPARLGIGTTGQVLTVASGLPSWATPASTSGLNLISTTAITGASSYSFNSCFTSTYKNYKIIWTSSVNASGGVDLKIRLRASGTDATGSNYTNSGSLTNTSGAPGVSALGSNGFQTSWKLNDTDYNGAFSSIEIFQPQAAVPTSFNASGIYRQASALGYWYQTAGSHDQATAYDGFTLYSPSGGFSGSVSIYGYGV